MVGSKATVDMWLNAAFLTQRLYWAGRMDRMLLNVICQLLLIVSKFKHARLILIMQRVYSLKFYTTDYEVLYHESKRIKCLL